MKISVLGRNVNYEAFLWTRAVYLSQIDLNSLRYLLCIVGLRSESQQQLLFGNSTRTFCLISIDGLIVLLYSFFSLYTWSPMKWISDSWVGPTLRFLQKTFYCFFEKSFISVGWWVGFFFNRNSLHFTTFDFMRL